ncbi:MAG: hypothetical protein KJ630_24920 [Proteobacteria bacterium]|nr:hypothetical protein [Pseudomonadota bacterium]
MMKLSKGITMWKKIEKAKSVYIGLIALVIVLHIGTEATAIESGTSSLSGSIQNNATSTTVLEKGVAIGTANFDVGKIKVELSSDNKSIKTVIVSFDKIDINTVRKEQGATVTRNRSITGMSYYFNGPFPVISENFKFSQRKTTCSGKFLSLTKVAGMIHLIVDITGSGGILSVDFGNLEWNAKK